MSMIFHPEIDKQANRLIHSIQKLGKMKVFFANTMLTMLSRLNKIDKTLVDTKVRCFREDGKKVQAHWIWREEEDPSRNRGIMLYFHGGAFLLKESPHAKRIVMDYVKNTSFDVLSVDYHLGEKSGIEGCLKDAKAALLWAKEFYDTILVAGDSAGGYLAAWLALEAKQKQIFPIAGQMLIYPVLDPYADTASMKKYTKAPLWNSVLSLEMRNRVFPKGSIDPYRLHLKDVSGLPPTYLEAHEHDCLHDEGVRYAALLQKHQVSVQLHDVKGSFHGVEFLDKTNFVKTLIANRIAFLQTISTE
ncbi:MAG: alpha/beta hydrolase fold domain-containing protein [Candidatus Izemoplasmatales bacterium]